MERSTEIKEIGKALITFHEVVDKVSKDSENPAFKRGNVILKYASLPNIQEAIKEPLKKAGLIYTQLPDLNNTLITFLLHPESGQFFKSEYSMNPIANTPQATGSAITYGKRYALAAMLGLQIDDDDDGNAASLPPKETKQDKKGDALVKEETLQQWRDELAKLSTIKEVTDLFNKSAATVNQYSQIKLLFTERRKQIDGTK